MLAITVDTDAIGQNRGLLDFNRAQFDYAKEVQAFVDHLCRDSIPVTFFVRIDRQVERETGDLLSVYQMFSDCGPHVELSWHPHVFSYDGTYSLANTSQTLDELRGLFSECPIISSFRGVRMGACQCDNEIMACLEELGFEYDSSGFPALCRKDSVRWFDWSQCPSHPYFPSMTSYQIPDGSMRNILEMPITTSATKTAYDQFPKLRQLNPSYRPEIFRPAVERLLGNSYVVMAFHCDELMNNYEDDLYVCGLKNCLDNLHYCLEYLKSQPVTMTTMRNIFLEQFQ